jgi:hypothetical protein
MPTVQTAQPKTRRSSWALALTPLIGACSFLLDFDELQSGPVVQTPHPDASTPDLADASGNGGNGGNGGQQGTAGVAGAAGQGLVDSGPLCPEGCDDGDPCTDDVCVNGVCEFSAASRIVEDGFSEAVSGSNVYRSTLIAGTDQFYLAVYGDLADGRDIALYRIPSVGDSWTPGPLISELDSFGTDVPISPAALVFDAASNTVYAYFAIGPSAPSNFFNAGQVQRAVLSDQLQASSVTAVSTDHNYRYVDNTQGPAAAQIPGGDVFVTWPGAPPPGSALYAGIYLQSGTSALPLAATPDLYEPAEVRGLAAIYGLGNDTDRGVKGALWQAQRNNANQVDTHMQLQGWAKQTFGQCVNNNVQGISVSTSRAHLDGFWFATWTKKRASSWVTEATSILCLGPGICAFNATCGDAQSQLDDVRNPKIATYHRLSDANSVAHQALVASQVDTANDSTAINLLVQRLSLENPEAGLTTSEVDTLKLAEGAASNGPDWPEVAVIEPDKVAVSWIESRANNDILHVNRYRICYGD